jgi:hypothetical protein
LIEETTTTTDVERILKYFDKIRMFEIMYCEDHDREFLKDEECPGCQSERDDRHLYRLISQIVVKELPKIPFYVVFPKNNIQSSYSILF